MGIQSMVFIYFGINNHQPGARSASHSKGALPNPQQRRHTDSPFVNTQKKTKLFCVCLIFLMFLLFNHQTQPIQIQSIRSNSTSRPPGKEPTIQTDQPKACKSNRRIAFVHRKSSRARESAQKIHQTMNNRNINQCN